MSKKYQKKPVTIEAVQVTEELLWSEDYEWPEWLQEAVEKHVGAPCRVNIENDPVHGDGLRIYTLEGAMFAQLGDYVIQGVKGELYPCKPDIFAATYFCVEEAYDPNPGPTTVSKLPGSFDARDWAREFRATTLKLNRIDLDEGWLVTWFANAIMAGYDERCRQVNAEPIIAAAKLDQEASKPLFYASRDGEQFGSSDPKNDPRAAIEALAEELAKDEQSTPLRLYVGERGLTGYSIDFDTIRNELEAQASGECGEAAEGLLDHIVEKDEKELEEGLNAVLDQWVDKHNLQAHCFPIHHVHLWEWSMENGWQDKGETK